MPETQDISGSMEVVNYGPKIDSLFNFADVYASQIYPNERFRYVLWLIDPATPQAKKDMILANVAWADSVWAEYLSRKQAILSGGEVNSDFSALGLPPHSFTDILNYSGT
jgi:hypothetical protein